MVLGNVEYYYCSKLYYGVNIDLIVICFFLVERIREV